MRSALFDKRKVSPSYRPVAAPLPAWPGGSATHVPIQPRLARRDSGDERHWKRGPDGYDALPKPVETGARRRRSSKDDRTRQFQDVTRRGDTVIRWQRGRMVPCRSVPTPRSQTTAR